MISYRQLIEKVETAKAHENHLHLRHIEDVVFYNGYQGVRSALSTLVALSRSPDSVHISEKWDGAPSIFFGPAPQSGRFFVATKSIFNNKPKVYFSYDEIDEHVKSSGLAKKLKIALKYLPQLNPRSILQGDYLFVSRDIKKRDIKGNTYLTFHPNTLLYGVEEDSQIARDIIQAKIGLVLHTKWDGDNIENLKPTYDVTQSDYDVSPSVFVHDPTLHLDDTTADIDKLVKAALIKAKSSQKTLDRIVNTKGLGQVLEQHYNTLVRKSSTQIGSGTHLRSLEKWLKDNKPKYSKSVDQNFKDVIELHTLITKIKARVYKVLNNRDTDISTFIKERDGVTYETDIEGYVIQKGRGQPYKLVDRADFSRHNFNDKGISKGWSKNA